MLFILDFIFLATSNKYCAFTGHGFDSHLELRFFLSSLSPHIFVYLIYYNDRPFSYNYFWFYNAWEMRSDVCEHWDYTKIRVSHAEWKLSLKIFSECVRLDRSAIWPLQLSGKTLCCFYIIIHTTTHKKLKNYNKIIIIHIHNSYELNGKKIDRWLTNQSARNNINRVSFRNFSFYPKVKPLPKQPFYLVLYIFLHWYSVIMSGKK